MRPSTTYRAAESAREPDGVVTGQPRRWLRVEGFTLLAVAVLLFATTHQPWWLVPLTILLPDLSMLGYLRDSRLGAALYNLGHAYPLPGTVAVAAMATHHPLAEALGLLWLAHIGMDRAAGYGLKYGTDFTHTHLGHIGHTSGNESTPNPPTKREMFHP